MTKPKENLTNEELKAGFLNQFDLVNCAIKYARDIIKERQTSAQDDSQNSAVLALIKLSQKDLP